MIRSFKRIMKKPVHLLSLMLCIALYSCINANDYDSRLLHAESIMEEHPDSALALLRSIDASSLDSRGDHMLYGQLLSQARTKNDEIDTTDLRKKGIIDYFESRRDDTRLMKALHYNANNALNRNELQAAISDATKSIDISKTHSDAYWCARNSELIADLFEKSYMFEEELPYRIDAYNYYNSFNRELNKLWALYELGINYDSLGDTIKYIKNLNSVIFHSDKNINDHKFWILNRYAKSSLYIFYISHNNYYNAEQFEADVIEIAEEYPDAASFCSLADANTHRGEYGTARAYLEKAGIVARNKQDSVYMYSSLTRLYRHAGDIEMCDHYTMLVNEYQIDAVRDSMKQSVAVEQRNLKQAELSEARERELCLRVWIVAIIIGVAGLVASGTVFYRSRIRLKNAEIEKQAADVLLLHASLDKERDGHAEKTELVRNLYKEHWETIGRLVKRLKKMERPTKEYETILLKIDAELRRLADPAMLPKIVAEIDKAYNGGISSLRDNPAINESDAAMAALIVAEIDTTTACRMLGISRNTFYSRRRRLLAKLPEGADDNTPAAAVIQRLVTLTGSDAADDVEDI